MTILYIILIILLFLLITLSFFTLWWHDLSLPNLSVSQLVNPHKSKTKILFVYPHPDDETMMSGGLIHQLSRDNRFQVTVMSLTKGERGDELVKLPPPELGALREKEFTAAVSLLGDAKPLIENFGDGQLKSKYEEIKLFLSGFIAKQTFDIVVTYERSGMYGHQDHVALSSIVHEIYTKTRGFKILYATIPIKIERRAGIRNHIKNLELEENEWSEQPEYKIPVFRSLRAKYNAAKAYKSQNLSHRSPLWVTIGLGAYEYYTTKYDTKTITT